MPPRQFVVVPIQQFTRRRKKIDDNLSARASSVNMGTILLSILVPVMLGMSGFLFKEMRDDVKTLTKELNAQGTTMAVVAKEFEYLKESHKELEADHKKLQEENVQLTTRVTILEQKK